MATVPEAIQQGLAHQRSGNLPAAEQIYRQVLTVAPRHPDAQHLLGLIAAQQGRASEAIARIGAAIAEAGTAPLFHHNLGNVYLGQERPAEAEGCFRRALAIDPDYVASQRQLAGVLQRSGRREESAVLWKRVLTRFPDDVDALNNYGVLLADAGDFAAAREHYERALRVRPDFLAAHNNLGNAWLADDDFARAEAAFQTALRIDPRYAAAQHNLGLLRAHQLRLAEAEAGYRRAIELDPLYAAAHADLGLLLLLQGDWQRGWPQFEWRRRIPGMPRRHFIQPTWDGTPLAGRTILLHAEEGLGDTLQFVRLASLVQARGGRVLLECPPQLCRLLGSMAGVDKVIPAGQPCNEFDVQAPLLALPGIMKMDRDAIPKRVPYLAAEPALVSRWRARLSELLHPQAASLKTLAVGIGWQGSRTFRFDGWRSMPLAQFAPLASVPGVRLVGLQKGAGSEQLATVGFPVIDLGCELDNEGSAFVDTAAVLKSLDLVITSDTALAHLAGALGVPAWVALPFAPDWRWQLGRDDSPWYPTLRLFRQPVRGDWAAVFSRMAAELGKVATK